MTIIAYARFSSGAQKDGTSIERQTEAAIAYAASRGWTIDEFITDEAKSAFKSKHKTVGQLGEIFKRVSNGRLGKGDVLIVENLDRLSREKITDAMFSIMTLMTAGLTVVTTDDGRVLTKDNYDEQAGDMFDTLIKVRLANEESEKKRSRQLARWETWREQGILTHRNPFWIAKDRTVIEDRARLVKRVFDMCETGMGATRIAATLTEEGIFAFGKIQNKKEGRPPFTGAVIAKLLKNRAVLGEYQARSGGKPVGPIVADYYPQVIDHDQFNRVNADIKTRRFRETGGKTGSGNIFKGVMVCAFCRSRMILHSVNYVRHYRCRLGAIKGCENKRLWNADFLEQAFLQSIKEIEVKTGEPTRLVELREEKARLERNVEIAKANAKTTFKLLLKMPDSETVKEELEGFENEAKALAARLVEIDQEMSMTAKPVDVHGQVLDLWSTFEGLEDKRDFRGRMNVLLKKLVRTMFIDDMGSLVFQLNNDTTYRLQYGLKADAAPRKAGSRPLTDYEWKLAGRVDAQVLVDQIKADQENSANIEIVKAVKEALV